MKIVRNSCYGGFSLSKKAVARYLELSGHTNIKLVQTDKWSWHYETDREQYVSSHSDYARSDSYLIQVVEELGDEANGDCAALEIVEIPDGIDWVISDYDGIETIEEVHRSW